MIKVFKNNNLHIKFEKEEIEAIKNGKMSDLEIFMYNYDFAPVGEEYCISNYDMAVDVSYNGGWNYYRLIYSKLYELCTGKMIVLKPHTKKYYNEFLKKEIEEDF